MFISNMTKIKFNIILGTVTSLFILWCACYVIKDNLTPLNKLNFDSSTVKEIKLTYYIDKFHKIPQYDICLFDKPYFIRISNDYRQYWNLINDDKSINKTIQYYYLTHVLNSTILSNPSQLSINGKIIYAYGANFSNTKSLVFLLVLFFLILGSITYFNIALYFRGSKSVKDHDAG